MNGRALSLALLLATTGLLSGCLVVPHKATLLHGTEVPEAATRTLQPGTTSREDVLHLLGRPTTMEDGERFFFYHWTMSSVLIVAGGEGGAGGGEIPTQRRFVCLEFDPAGRLVRWARVADGALFKSEAKTIKAWIAAPPSAPARPGVPP